MAPIFVTQHRRNWCQVSVVRRWQFTLASVANLLPTRCFLRHPNRCKSLGTRSELLWRCSIISQPQHHNQSQVWLASVSLDPQGAPDWQAIGSKWWHEASCHLIAIETGHLFLLCWDTSLDAMAWQLIKCQWCGDLMCTIRSPICHMYTELRINFSPWESV